MGLVIPLDEGELKNIAFKAASLINDANFADTKEDQAKLQGLVTTTYLNVAQEAFPTKNIMVAATPHVQRDTFDLEPNDFERNFAGEKRGILSYLFGAGVSTKIYNLYVFDSGDCTLHSDGGFENWAFVSADGAPNFVQDGGHVTFFPVPPPPPPSDPSPPPKPSDTPHPAPPSQPAPPAPTPPAPTAERPDGVYLVNSFRGDEKSSGLAFYKNITFGGNDGQQPDDYVDISHGSVVNWGGNHSGKFSNGTEFTVFLTQDAENQSINTQVGTASNTFRPMVVFKDRQRVLYEVDGWQVFTLFWCN